MKSGAAAQTPFDPKFNYVLSMAGISWAETKSAGPEGPALFDFEYFRKGQIG
jgi:hypothetical protein